jgi:AcrR family transcriptional regulator
LSIPELKEKERKKRSEYIIDAAEKLFFSKGYDNVSMNDIANEVGISRTALYLYFKNKEMIYFRIVIRAARIMIKMFKNSIKSQKNGLNKLGDAGRAYFEFYNDFPDYYEAYIYFDSQRFSKIDNKYITEINAFSNETIKVMLESIGEGIKDGSIRSDINPLEVAIFIATTTTQVVKIKSNTLETLGISYEQYVEDSLNLYKHMLMNI